MGARAEYSRWGGITAPTFISRGRCRTFKPAGDFFKLWQGGMGSEITARQAVRARLRPICRITPSFRMTVTAGNPSAARSVPGSRKRYREPGLFPSPGYPKWRQRRAPRLRRLRRKLDDLFLLQLAHQRGDLVPAHRAVAELQLEHAALAALDDRSLIAVEQRLDIRKTRVVGKPHQRPRRSHRPNRA